MSDKTCGWCNEKYDSTFSEKFCSPECESNNRIHKLKRFGARTQENLVQFQTGSETIDGVEILDKPASWPWRTRELVNGITAIYGPGEYDIVVPRPGMFVHPKDAKLIAAAPELLCALRSLLGMVTDNRTHGIEVYRAVEAIDKAGQD